MKAHEVLNQYAAGRRDFSGENLRGQFFKGKDLSGTNFSETDIRGANFTNATLQGANFRRAKAGLSHRWAIEAGLIIISLVLSALSESVTVAAILITVIATFVASAASRVESKATIVALTVSAVLSIAGTVSLVLAVAISVVMTKFESLVVARTGGITLALALIGFVALALIGTRADLISVAVDRAGAGFIRVSLALAGELVKIAMTVTGGTSFRGADLTDADFSQANLKSTNLRKAIFRRVRWNQAKNLDKALFSRSYLNRPKVQQLLTKGAEEGENFDRQNLRGINLQGTNLADASFIGADLSEANLQDADLSRAKLVQTQLNETDLTGATLTGAYIEDWGITSHTKLDGVRCEYVFMRVPTKEDPNPRRKPDNWKETFSDGDFADFIKPIVDTLDLYHNQDVDPRAVAISFKQLAENHPEAELEIVAMEKRGGDKFMLRVATAPDANHSELNAEYFDTYNEIKALAPRELQALLAEKDSRISSLENMIATALQRPSFYANTYHQVGDFMSESKGNISITSGDGSKISGVAGAGENMTGSAMADVSGTVTIAINELPDSSEPEKPGIKELLSQLQAAINDPNLADDDKAQVLEQIKVLAEAGQNPNNETAQKQAKRAMGFLKVIAEGLPSAAQLVKTCQDVLPAIAHFFGL